MLNRRNPRPAPSPVFDRCRAGERLQAALAGLQELELLKESQRELVRRALETQPPRAKPGRDGGKRQSCTEEDKLEATLSALKEQLSHLRKQDAGLKIHLQHLDRQISELKLDVNKASTEQQENDSRPSSGFYDLSDGGSCSLSNSCTSMYSECNSSSQGSLRYCSQPAGTKAGRSEDRPRSADDIIAQSAAFEQRGAGKWPGRGIKTTTEPLLAFHIGRLAVPRQRPVSTGDLERFAPLPREPPGVSDRKPLPSVSAGSELHLPLPNQKFRCDLVSKNSGDVYSYPSPLHAVALQSPLFCLTEQATSAGNSSTPPPASGSIPVETRTGCINEQGPHQPCRVNKAATGREPGMSPRAAMQEEDLSLSDEALAARGQLKRLACLRQGDHCKNVEFPAENTTNTRSRLQEANGFSTIPPVTDMLGQESKVASSSRLFRLGVKDQPVASVPASCSGLPDSKGLACDGCCAPSTDLPHRTGQRSGVTAGKGKEALPKSGFVQAQYVPAESRLRVRILPAGGKTKVAKIKRRNGEVTRAGRRLTARGVGAFRSTAEADRASRSAAMATTSVGHEAPGRSCSESSLHPVCYRPEFQSRALCGLPESMAGEDGTEAKSRPWQSNIEIFHRAPTGHLGFSAQRQKAGSHWAARAVSFSRVRTLRCPAARSESDQSEYSAECASLFHSTVAESSGDEHSDHTANRFGDSESSGSEGCPNAEAADRHTLIWPPGSGRQKLCSEARICRIKASKALKKKIRRFQPEALKVMTMV
ncbi:dapper homolog 2 isoform X1 [Scyliorhinus torazame]|uniref:dapper homolog 2 isoform X1 n=1 Tax=Scyliorhinus torazame TaxID=75743 RepID=UPI003B5BFDB7